MHIYYSIFIMAMLMRDALRHLSTLNLYPRHVQNLVLDSVEDNRSAKFGCK